MTVNEHTPPPENDFVYQWVRGLDPFHPDAFPPELRHQMPKQCNRKSGWEGLDWVGNMIVFVADGTVIRDKSQ